jgi:hypothetical protein
MGGERAVTATTPARRRAYMRAYSAARQRALLRLAKRHRGEYAALLAEERAKKENT